jgi:hypothetical protein
MEEVHVEQPQGFENFYFPNHIFRLKKALYHLKQAPRAWYDRLKCFFLLKIVSTLKKLTPPFLHREKVNIYCL